MRCEYNGRNDLTAAYRVPEVNVNRDYLVNINKGREVTTGNTTEYLSECLFC